ncbi:hypothetical protein BH20ACT9_BH20ACT9_19610 [soil metagenome]
MTTEEDAMTRAGTDGRAPLSAEGGSIPMAMLAAIAVAGLIVVIAGATLAGQRATRFDQSFSEDIHGADAGVQDALYRLNAGYFDPGVPVDSIPEGGTYPTTPGEREDGTIDDTTYAWYAERTGPRDWRIESVGTLGGVERTVVAEIEERARFAPGAFSDSTLALSGTSSGVDSYTSGACAAGTGTEPSCHWYPDTDGFGTGNGAIGSNDVVEVSGNTRVKRIVLYDWDDNPGGGVTETDPGGDRCNGESAGSPCITPGVVQTVGYELDYGSEADTAFITDRLDECAAEGRLQGETTLKAGDLDVEQDFYCYEGAAFEGDFPLPVWASATNPVVIYVRDYVSVLDPGARVNCVGCDKNNPHGIAPVSGALQIYSAGDFATQGANVGIKSQSMFAGVIYAPRSRCGSESGGAGVHVYGSMTCGLMDNVGNWEFHFDDALSSYGTDAYNVAYWTEE